MKVTKQQYQRRIIDYKTVRKSMTVPDQAMSIKEIVRRFVRGIPVDVVQRKPIYMDQNDHDFEQLSRMEFGDKAEMAEQLKAENEARKQQYVSDEEEKRMKNEQAAKKERIKAAKLQHSRNLDNTMLHDTRQK